MEITKLIEQNPTILRLGLHLEYNDARHRISAHLQRNLDRSKQVANTLIISVSSYLVRLLLYVTKFQEKGNAAAIIKPSVLVRLTQNIDRVFASSTRVFNFRTKKKKKKKNFRNVVLLREQRYPLSAASIRTRKGVRRLNN